jgi:septal ring factor EnvC (AmiA/AmiB activator)
MKGLNKLKKSLVLIFINMKIWKYILGALAFIAGIFAISSSSKNNSKKVLDEKIKENNSEIKEVKVKTQKTKSKKDSTQKQLSKATKTTANTKAKVKSTKPTKKTTKSFSNKYRKK